MPLTPNRGLDRQGCSARGSPTRPLTPVITVLLDIPVVSLPPQSHRTIFPLSAMWLKLSLPSA